MNDIEIDHIQEYEDYWVLPVHLIGCLGVLVERQTGRSWPMGSMFSSELWRWGAAHGLLQDPPRDVVIDEIFDESRATVLARALMGRGVPALRPLPFVIVGGARPDSIAALHAAGDAVTWHVR